jgi:hypothetical protein
VSKLESEIVERDYNVGLSTLVTIVDPTPGGGYRRYSLLHITNGRMLSTAEARGGEKPTAFPVRNSLKRDS